MGRQIGSVKRDGSAGWAGIRQAAAVGGIAWGLCVTALAGDWPCWRGPDGDSVSKETGLLKSWPGGGPKILWRTKIGAGFSGISVSEAQVYTLHGHGGQEHVVCFDAATGKKSWEAPLGSFYHNDWGSGPRATPVVDGGRVYALSAQGDFACLKADSGEKLWGLNLLEQYGGNNLDWGLSGSPFIEENMVLLNLGSPGNSILALDKETGERVWGSLDDKAGYSTPVPLVSGGVRQMVFFTALGLVGVLPEDGKELWRYDWRTEYDVNAATPIVVKDHVFISSNYDAGCALLRIVKKGEQWQAVQVYRNKAMMNHFSTCVLVDRSLYGFHNDRLKCIDYETGQMKWTMPGDALVGKGSVTAAEGLLYLLGEKGQLALVRATPQAYVQVARVPRVFGRETKCWTVPTISNGRLYLRDEAEMLCLDISAK